MSAELAEALPLYLEKPQLTEGELTALMTRGSVESQIAAKLRLLEAIQHVPESTCGDQRDRLTGEIGTLTVLLAMPDDELVLTARTTLQSMRPKAPQDKILPPLVLHKAPKITEPETRETEDTPLDTYAQIEEAFVVLRAAVQQGLALSEEEQWSLWDRITDICEGVQGDINTAADGLPQSETVPEETGASTMTQEVWTNQGSTIEFPEPDEPDSVSLEVEDEERTGVVAPEPLITHVENPDNTLLPEDFRWQVLALVSQTPTVHRQVIANTIFGTPHVKGSASAAMHAELEAMINDGTLQRRGPKGFSLPMEQRRQLAAIRQSEDDPRQTRKDDRLASMIHKAGIPDSPTSRRRRRGNK